ncbi:DUF58 domain-containing protein [Paenibacillus dakarensis]|uniref:DUF58 domain-containing protein n=1 Tax=Paenibacillus dakarensis TaxID=1527293 RepID=UPI0006D5501F|nr:DUF58 domain-containing protein [Paenibacillus dakarensis]
MGAYWILLITVVVVILQSSFFNLLGMKRITYSRSFKAASCFEGENLELVEVIENRKMLPVPWLRVESQFRAGIIFRGQHNLDISEGQFNQNHKSFFSLMPWTKIVRRHHVTAAKRGVYHLGTVSITSGDLLGINSSVLSIPLSGKVTVYPEPMEIEDMSLPVQTWMGDLSVRRWIVEDPFLISGVREYREGDPLKDIHWKASARSGLLQVRRRETTADSRIKILLNIEDHEQMWNTATNPDRVEHGIRLAAGIASHLLSLGMEIGFGSNGRLADEPNERISIPVSGGREQTQHILEALARLELNRIASFHDYLIQELEELEDRQDILILSTYMSERLDSVLNRFKEQGHRVQIALLEETFEHQKEASA